MGRRGREKKKQNESKPKTQQLPYIPEAIVLEILSRLPIDSLLRFTIVSKSWRSSILDPKFSLSTPTPRVVIASGWSKQWNGRGRVSLHTITTTDNNRLASAEKLPHPSSKLKSHKRDINVMGSCKGLLLVSIREDLFLWNPSTRCFKLVLAYNRLLNEGYSVESGLCFDSSTREYKAVLALAPEYHSDSEDREFVVVGDFRNRSWTEVNFPYSVRKTKSGPVVNELLHWRVQNKVIVCFEPKTNEFVDLPLPQDYSKLDDDGEENQNIILGLGVLEGCLCMVHFDHGNVEVLAMKEHGVKESWTRMFVLFNFGKKIDSDDSLVPLCWTKGGEFVMVLHKKYLRIMLAFNTRENSHRHIRIQPKNNHLKAVMWEESLVSVPAQYDWEEDEVQGKADYVEMLHSPIPDSEEEEVDEWYEDY